MASIERSKQQPEKAGDGIFVYREVAMQNSPFPGVEFRVLYSDLQTGMMTSMLKLAAGSSYPAHEHAGAEQSYVIEGSCHIGDLWLSKGEFAFAEAGSRHDVLHSDEGCLLLIVSSKHDKLLDLPKQAAL